MMDSYEVKRYKAIIDVLKDGGTVHAFKHNDHVYYYTGHWFFAAKDIFKVEEYERDFLKDLDLYGDEFIVDKVELRSVDKDVLYLFSNEAHKMYVSADFKKLFGDPLKSNYKFKMCGNLVAIYDRDFLVGGHGYSRYF